MDLDFVYTVQGLEVSFRIVNKVPAGTTLVWDFGDYTDTVSDNDKTNPKHVYETSGIYTVTLKASKDEDVVNIVHTLLVSDHVSTLLPDSIYNLIDYYIPSELNTTMKYSDKKVYINKWQLYIQPLVNHEVPLEEYSNELYYEALENQLVMELAVWDYLHIELSQMLTSTSAALSKITSESSSSSSSGEGEGVVGHLKQITTGPTEVQYYDTLTDSVSSLYKALSQALSDGGLIDRIKANLCMLAQRLDIWLPICDQVKNPYVPQMDLRRLPGHISGPNPGSLVNKPKPSII